MTSTRRGARLLLGLLVLALALALAGCRGGPRAVPLDELAANPDAFDGQQISTVGRVRPIEDETDPGARHFVLEDKDFNRVLLLPADQAEEHAGAFVRVVGRFAFDETTGRRLDIEEIERP